MNREERCGWDAGSSALVISWRTECETDNGGWASENTGARDRWAGAVRAYPLSRHDSNHYFTTDCLFSPRNSSTASRSYCRPETNTEGTLHSVRGALNRVSATMKVAVVWNVTPYASVHVYRNFGDRRCIHLQSTRVILLSRYIQIVPPQSWHISNKLHGVTPQKAITFKSNIWGLHSGDYEECRLLG
jgi:hypothetical protein